MAKLLASVLGVVLVSSVVLAEDVKKFGKPLEGLEAVSLEQVMKNPVAGQKVRVEGTIDKVCQNKGCWIALKQGARSVHVTFEGYSFFVPKDTAGKRVALEGKVLLRDPPPDEVEHLKSEGAGAEASARLSIEATGVEIRR